MNPPPGTGGLDPELDERLVARCRAGEPRAWEALVRRHQRLVYGVARSYRLSDEDLGDVFQEVFAALLRALERLRDGRALVRWLSVTTDRIARTTALKRRREEASSRVPGGTPGDPFEHLADPGEPVGADLERLEREATVRMALATVPERCRRLLQALYYEDPVPGYAELAERLGVPIGSLGPTRARCFEKMKSAFDGLAGPGIRGGAPPTSFDEDTPRGRPRAASGRPPLAVSEEGPR